MRRDERSAVQGTPRASRRRFLALGCACCATALARPLVAEAAPDPAAEGLPQALELGVGNMTRIAKTVWVAPLGRGLWLHTTTSLIDGGIYYPANGLVLERDAGALLIDTGYVPDHAEVLLSWSRTALSRPISEAVATHFHADRTGGIPGLQHHGITTRAFPLTCELARTHGVHVPEPLGGFRDGIARLGEDCELYFPGAGHTRDNVVAWLPRHEVLFGGCFVKSATSAGLGNIADADVGAWSGSVRRAAERYPRAKIVVPGHGTIEGDPIGKTLALLKSTPSAEP